MADNLEQQGNLVQKKMLGRHNLSHVVVLPWEEKPTNNKEAKMVTNLSST